MSATEHNTYELSATRYFSNIHSSSKYNLQHKQLLVFQQSYCYHTELIEQCYGQNVLTEIRVCC